MPIERTSTTKRLIDLIGLDRFDNSVERGSVADVKMYRIPEHNRFPQWNQEKGANLVDSIMHNYPIHTIMLSRHGNTHFNIEDGQTRMSVLQNYLKGAFTWNELHYNELSQEQQTNFNTYETRIEILEKRAETDDDAEFNRQIREIFARLNSGKPLTGNDKYHLYVKTSPVLRLIMDMKEDDEFQHSFRKYIGGVGTGKTRRLLSDMMGAVLPLILTGEIQTDCINTSYERNHCYLSEDVTDHGIANVKEFFRFYFTLLNDGLPVGALMLKKFGKLSGILGLLVYSWVTNRENTIGIHRAKWVRYVSEGLNKDYNRIVFHALNAGDARNLVASSIRKRVDCILAERLVELNIIPQQLNAANEDLSDTEEDDDESM
jgi:hypothetical protein